MALARLFETAWLALFGASLVTDHAYAQGTNTAAQTQNHNGFSLCVALSSQSEDS